MKKDDVFFTINYKNRDLSDGMKKIVSLSERISFTVLSEDN